MFDFTDAMERLVRHITANCPKLAHVQPDRVLVAHIRSRSPGTHGVYASLQPLRFKDGATTFRRGIFGRTYAMPQVVHEGREIMYIVYFALPRFVNLDFEAKLTTVFHELYHIGPEFNGDIRRFPGKKYAHGGSRKRFNERVSKLAMSYLSKPGADEHTAFLRLSFDELNEQHGGVVGTKIKPPRPKPV